MASNDLPTIGKSISKLENALSNEKPSSSDEKLMQMAKEKIGFVESAASGRV